MQQAQRIGITGGIGSGKSYVARLLTRQYSIPIYDCDAEAKRLNVQSDEIRQALIRLVGPDIYASDGSLQRSVLAQYLFASSDNAQRVNAIVHPVVARDFEQWAQRQSDLGQSIVALESAILFESGFDHFIDYSINVSAPHDLRLQRAMLRDEASRQSIEARMQRQMSDQERSSLSHFTLINDGRELEVQIQYILQEIRAKNKNKQ